MQIDDPSPEYNAYHEGVLYGMERGIHLLIAADLYRNQYAFFINDSDEICWTRHFRGELETEGVGIRSLLDDAKRQNMAAMPEQIQVRELCKNAAGDVFQKGEVLDRISTGQYAREGADFGEPCFYPFDEKLHSIIK